MPQFDDKIEHILSTPPYGQPAEERQASLVENLKEERDYGCQAHDGGKNYARRWPLDYRSATQVADLPHSPVAIPKANPP